MTYLPSNNPLGAHVAAFEAGEYKEFLRLAREEPPQIPVELVVLEDLLAEYAVVKLPESREKWDGRVGEFVVALGHAPAGTSAHEFFASEWEWTEGPEEGALAIAQDNLRTAARKGAKLSNQYVSELISTGWRDDALGRLQSIAQGEPEWFLTTACAAAPPASSKAHEFRSLLLQELVERAGGSEALGEMLDGDYWWDCWRAFSSGRAGDDVVRFALELLGKRS
jgi:hypothetical protein